MMEGESSEDQRWCREKEGGDEIKYEALEY